MPGIPLEIKQGGTSMIHDPRPPGWSEHKAMAVIIDGLDEVSRSYEAKWGVGRLDLLVSDELREKFRKQVIRLNQAIIDHDLEPLRKSAEAMKRAWVVLESAAIADGRKPLEPDVWEIPMPGGRVVAFTRTNAEAAAVTRSGRYLDVWTVNEIARVIDKFPEIALAKETFPGALVASVRTKLPAVDWATGDEIPF